MGDKLPRWRRSPGHRKQACGCTRCGVTSRPGRLPRSLLDRREKRQTTPPILMSPAHSEGQSSMLDASCSGGFADNGSAIGVAYCYRIFRINGIYYNLRSKLQRDTRVGHFTGDRRGHALDAKQSACLRTMHNPTFPYAIGIQLSIALRRNDYAAGSCPRLVFR